MQIAVYGSSAAAASTQASSRSEHIKLTAYGRSSLNSILSDTMPFIHTHHIAFMKERASARLRSVGPSTATPIQPSPAIATSVPLTRKLSPQTRTSVGSSGPSSRTRASSPTGGVSFDPACAAYLLRVQRFVVDHTAQLYVSCPLESAVGGNQFVTHCTMSARASRYAEHTFALYNGHPGDMGFQTSWALDCTASEATASTPRALRTCRPRHCLKPLRSMYRIV